MDMGKMQEALDYILTYPEDALSEFGTDRVKALLHKLSELPGAEEKIRNSEIVKLIEGGRKYITGVIVQEDKSNE